MVLFWKICHRVHKPYVSFKLRLCMYVSFYRHFQSFQSLFESLFLLVSIAVWIYLNRLQNTGALELNYFVFETFLKKQFFYKYQHASFSAQLLTSQIIFWICRIWECWENVNSIYYKIIRRKLYRGNSIPHTVHDVVYNRVILTPCYSHSYRNAAFS